MLIFQSIMQEVRNSDTVRWSRGLEITATLKMYKEIQYVNFMYVFVIGTLYVILQ